MSGFGKLIIWIIIVLAAFIGIFFRLKILALADILVIAFCLFWFNRKK